MEGVSHANREQFRQLRRQGQIRANLPLEIRVETALGNNHEKEDGTVKVFYNSGSWAGGAHLFAFGADEVEIFGVKYIKTSDKAYSSLPDLEEPIRELTYRQEISAPDRPKWYHRLLRRVNL